MGWVKHNKLLIGFIFLLVLIPLIAFVVTPSIKNNKLIIDRSIQPLNQPLSKTNFSNKLFYADLEYNPNTKTVTQLRTGTTEGTPVISPSQPLATTSGQFIYKVDVHSKDDKFLEQYWQAIPEKIIKTANNTFKFRITALYEQGAIIRLTLLDNRLIWTGVIK